jgi:DNA-binding response OmpR family regulator
MKNLRILFLEDNIYFVEALMEVFERLGWLVTHVTSVKSAKDIFSDEKFDLVISDLHLQDLETGTPNSGLDLVHYIRRRRKSQIPLIVTTGLELISKESLLENEVNLFFYKSEFDIKQFIASIEKLVSQSISTKPF